MGNDCDYETFTKKSQKKHKKYNGGDDLPGMFSDLFSAINYKTAIFLFILGILVFSDVFIELVLVPMDDAVDGDIPTNKGTLIQLLSLTFGYIIIDLLGTGGII